MPPCSGQSRPSPAGSREDAASLDRPCARRLRELAVGMEEYSRRGSNQRMRPKRAGKPTISNRWFSSNFRLALTLHPVSSCTVMQPPDSIPLLQFHYRTFIARTNRSAPVLHIGTLASWLQPLVLLPLH